MTLTAPAPPSKATSPDAGQWRTWIAVDAPPAKPTFTTHPDGGPGSTPSFEIALSDDLASFGKWISPPLPVRPGATYRCRLWQRTEALPHPELSAPALITWRGPASPPWSRPWTPDVVNRGRPSNDADPQLVERRYIRPARDHHTSDRWTLLETTMRAPDHATTLEFEGWLRFAPRARAWYAGATLEEVPALPQRLVTLGTVRATPPPNSTLEDNRRLLVRLIEAAAAEGAQVVCLPENALTHNTGLRSDEAAEPLDGPTVSLLSRVAAEKGVYVVAQFPERRGHHLHNTAILLDRHGQTAAVYHKMHLTIGEWERGIVPGSGPVVAETDIGRLGFLVCFDLHFPEASRLTTLAGAEVIFGPTVGDRWADRRDAVTRAHAVTNGVYVVTSLVYHPSDIVDTEGRLIAQAAQPNSIAVATVDLDYKSTVEGRSQGPDNGTAPNTYWPTLRRDLYDLP